MLAFSKVKDYIFKGRHGRFIWTEKVFFKTLGALDDSAIVHVLTIQ